MLWTKQEVTPYQRVMNAKTAKIPVHDAHLLILRAASRMALNEKDIAEPYGPYAAKYLGALLNKADELEQAADALASGLPDGETPSVRLLALTNTERANTYRLYGDPQLRGVNTSLNPDLLPGGLQAAMDNEDAISMVDQHIGDVYAERSRGVGTRIGAAVMNAATWPTRFLGGILGK